MFDNKLYLEFGGKIFDDFHASRVLPGFRPDNKIRMLKKFKDDLEVIFCINAGDIERNKIQGKTNNEHQASYSVYQDIFNYGLFLTIHMYQQSRQKNDQRQHHKFTYRSASIRHQIMAEPNTHHKKCNRTNPGK